ncbi:uncharacterized protein METZ01_LOCUS139002 [marine metagenome]|uniref:Major tropism determinant N-terminal domain-containing protein n=1 Tax=marine metagenome TaxID=408172 RepID=A0A381ZA58_9ZZZZ
MALRLRRGTNSERALITPADGELIYTTDTKILYIGDGTTVGGNPVDTAGTAFGANVDLNNFDLIGTGNINTTGNITITGNITADGNLTLGGNLEIGDATTDTVSFVAKVESHIIPDVDGARNIGASTNKFNQGWFNAVHVAQDVIAAEVNANIIADDSTVLLNKATGAMNTSGTFKGDVNADDSTSFYDATTKAVNAGAGTFTGEVQATTFTGTLVGDVKGSVFADDSTVLVDGINGALSNGTLTFSEGVLDINSIPVVGKRLTIGKNTDTETQGINFKAGSAAGKVIDVEGLTDGANSTGFDFTVSRGDLATKTAVQDGDDLVNIKISAHDGTNTDTVSSAILFGAEPGATIANGAVPGVISIVATPDNGSNWSGMSINSSGQLCVGGTLTPAAGVALDVTGNATVTGYTKFGNLTTVERDALTPTDGMIIYNTTDSKFQGRTGVAWVDLH